MSKFNRENYINNNRINFLNDFLDLIPEDKYFNLLEGYLDKVSRFNDIPDRYKILNFEENPDDNKYFLTNTTIGPVYCKKQEFELIDWLKNNNENELYLDLDLNKRYSSKLIGTIQNYFDDILIDKIKNYLDNKDSEETIPLIFDATIDSMNNGGFNCTVLGHKFFMPGSFISKNKVTNYDSYLGKTVEVVPIKNMYIHNTETLDDILFSHKEYLNNLSKIRIKTLKNDIENNPDKVFTGKITGITKYGLFIEFFDIFNCLLHSSYMTEEEKNNYSNDLKVGDEYSFKIFNIDERNRIFAKSLQFIS